jgi:class 3 adenylate cyclase/tetratricopeptide (TPR) repeat protein
MARELPEGTVTVLFTDVVGSTSMRTGRGDAAAQEIIHAHFDLVRHQIEQHSGQEVKTIGDSFMVAFASARKAVECAMAVQKALEEHNRRRPDQQVQVRIGLNTGEAIREEEDLFGSAVDAAARIMAKAEGGQILVSETVRAVIGSAKDLQFVDRGRFRLKGFPERWRLYEVVWRKEAPTAGPAVAERTPFVGREAERAELRRLLDQSIRGQGALVMIGGEPGVGKTRLAEEVLLEARQRGFLAWSGRCYEMEGAPPYIPFVEILESAARVIPQPALREALGDSAPEVAKLLPELRRLFPDIPPPLELPPEQERHYLFNSVREFVAWAARAQPLLLILDDLHWGDDATLLLLQHIAQQLREVPVLILGTYRDVELDVARPLARALEELLRQRLAHRIALRRLPQDGVAAMLRALSGQEPPTTLVEAVYAETEGNPFFVEEVFQHLTEEGKLFDAQGRWRADLRVEELDVPEGVRLVIGRRLERVCEDCRRVLTAAAVIGRGFSFELLDALGDPSAGSGQGVDTDALLDAVDEAERARLIIAASDGPEARFTFAHELIRQTLIGGLSLPRRQRLHLRIAEAMERAYARSIEEHAADLAHHLYQAGAAADPEKTVRYLALAGDQALAAAAFEDALRHYENALSLHRADDRKGRADLLYRRGLALRSLGRWEEALDDWREAVATYEELGDGEAAGRICTDISYQLAWGARFEESLDIGRRGLVALGEGVSAERCRLLGNVGRVLSIAGQYSAGSSMLAQSLAMAEEVGEQRLLGEILGYKTRHHWYNTQYPEAVDAGMRAAELLRSAGDLWNLADALWTTEWSLLSLGRLDEAAKIGQELEPLAASVGHLGALVLARTIRAFRELMLTGDIDAWQELARDNLELARSIGFGWVSNYHMYLGLGHFWRGEWEKALQDFQEAVKVEAAGFYAGAAWGYLSLFKAYAGDSNGALAMLEQERQNLPRPGQANTMGAWSMLLAEVEGLAILNEREEASKLYPLVGEAIDTRGLLRSPEVGLLQTVAGMAAAAGGHWKKAEEHYQTALRQAHELPVVIGQPEVRRWYARMLIDRDASEHPEPVEGRPSRSSGADLEKARQLLEEAIAMYRQIGMPKHVEMAEEMLNAL